MIAYFAELVNDVAGWQSTAEKRRALRGLEEMLRMGKSYIRSALPQVSKHSQLSIISLTEWLD
jgi:hypothetical protein